ncbi:serine/threonine-protein kinase [Sphingobium yanoikuyae]|uniref:serine/threonine-protein kinase n=1 Tax=Sphingobium yanoikuyae TaxID=13690 RepID=UPI0028AA0D22|nr:serine/threonine-protein kinase [Sphingobium yanoikuyae]
MPTIRLEKGQWTFSETDQLGPPGGFGEVFRGEGDGRPVAVKRLKISAGAASHREMAIGSVLAERDHAHVVPIFDYGRDAESDRYFLVMPVCDHSVQDFLNTTGPLSYDAAKSAALSVVKGLLEVKDIVHRDLKPGNVLWHEDRWKIADFGIAKFVEDATSLESLRSSLTPAYAAPEQWRGERPTNATDVYALGCMYYAMLGGQAPFVGDLDTVRESHLHQPAPALSGVDPRLAGLIATMLRKSPAARPSLERCKTVIETLAAGVASTGRAALAAAGNAVSQQEAAAEAERKAKETAAAQRQELEREGLAELDGIIGRLFDLIAASAETVRREPRSVRLGPAHLTLGEGSRTAYGRAQLYAGGGNPYDHGWDVVANAYLTLKCDLGGPGSYRPSEYNFSTTLVFATMPGDSDYRWRELSFMEVFSAKPMHEQPIALNPLSQEFAVALSNVVGRHQVACGPWTIDGEDEDLFEERWLRLFAKAANRQLQPPNQLPLPDSFFA